MKTPGHTQSDRDSLVLQDLLGAHLISDPSSAGIRQAQQEVLERLQAASPGVVLEVSFQGISLSASCIAAILAPVLAKILSWGSNGPFVVAVDDPSGLKEWEANAALKYQSEHDQLKLVCVWSIPGRNPSLVGAVDHQVRATYEFVLDEGSEHGTTARALAERDGISIQAASNRLAKTAQLGVLHLADREPVSGGGNQNVYTAVH